MNKGKLITIFLMLLLGVSGCSSEAKFYNKKILVARIKISGAGSASYKDKDMEFTYDTKQLNPYDRYITPLLRTAVDRGEL